MLKDFTVIEIRKKVGRTQMIIDPKRLRFSRHVIEALEYSPYVHFLVNARDKKLAIQICREKDGQSTRFSKPREEQGQKSTLVQNEALMATLHELMPELNDGQRHSVLGVYSSQDKAVIYDLKDSVIWMRGSRKKADTDSDDEMEDYNE